MEKDPLDMSWNELNAWIMQIWDEGILLALERRERDGRRRKLYVSRLRSRYNRLREIRERREMDGG